MAADDTTIEAAIVEIITDMVHKLDRNDLVREPLVAFSSAQNPEYQKLKDVIGSWHMLPCDVLPEAESVISYFIPFTKLVSREPKGVEHGSPLWSEAYAIVNPYFDEINNAVVNYLTAQGYFASAIRATHNFDPETIICKWSHRSVASIAGLGKFGANRMVITPKGSGGRFCSVITSAPLDPALGSLEEPTSDLCLFVKNGSCGKCFEMCPANALEADDFEKFACQAVTIKNKELFQEDPVLGQADTCGKCISVCPFAYLA